ncbi:MAG TPA: DUF4190 domain-containing protein [Pilimelia sp.]|nr:DUF4190 domain-containing protein [Pilimelia sp.]
MTQPPPPYQGPPPPYQGPASPYQGPPPAYPGSPAPYPAPAYPPAPGVAAAPQPYGWQPPPKPGTNGFAIASLVLGVIGGVLLSVIFGILALVQIRKQPQGGKGLAITGLVLSGLWLALIVVVGVVAIVTSASRDWSGQINSGGSVAVDELAVGDCVNGLTESGEITDLPAVPCAEPHEGEVFAIFDLSGSKWPGDQAVADEAERSCGERFDSYVADPDRGDSLQLYFLRPTARSWRLGDHGVTCIALDPEGKLTGSLRDR